MAVHPVIQAALAAGAGLPPYSALPIHEARAQAMLPYQGRTLRTPVADVRDLQIPGPATPVPVRVYRPPVPGPRPLLVFFHGSGFVVLGLDSHDDLCRRLCAGADCVVVSVDYRLAPEHPFPAAPDDCLAATLWAVDHAQELGADPSRLALAGDSAGACLAAVTALRLRDQAGPAVDAQLLFYPVTNHPTPAPASYTRYGTGYGLTAEGMHWFWNQYLARPQDAGHPHASPLRAPSLAGLPAARVVVAEYDVLREEGEAFAGRLSEAGVPVDASCIDGMNHGFLKYADAIPEVATVIADACTWLSGVWQRAAGRAAVSAALLLCWMSVLPSPTVPV